MKVVNIKCGDKPTYDARVDRSFLCIRCGKTVSSAGDQTHKVGKP